MTVVDFEWAKHPHALSLIRDNQMVDVRHAAYTTLGAYDCEHGTQLGETLQALVANRGIPAGTCRQLFMRRTTLAYRLDRIVGRASISMMRRRGFTWRFLTCSHDGRWRGIDAAWRRSRKDHRRCWRIWGSGTRAKVSLPAKRGPIAPKCRK